MEISRTHLALVGVVLVAALSVMAFASFRTLVVQEAVTQVLADHEAAYELAKIRWSCSAAA